MKKLQITLDNANNNQSPLLNGVTDFKKRTKSRDIEKKNYKTRYY